MSVRIKLSWVRYDGLSYAVARDENSKRLFLEITDYSVYLSKIRRFSSVTVESEMYHVSTFLLFLFGLGKQVSEVNDISLREFRDSELKRLTISGNGSSPERVYMRTVNARLRRVYRFLMWYQDFNLGVSGLIGPHGAVTCYYSLGASGESQRSKNVYPLLLVSSGSSSRHRLNFVATEEHLRKLRTYFAKRFDGYLRHRNLLLIEVANVVGLRRGSINSLTCSLFLDSVAQSEGIDDARLVPPSQKFGYQNEYEFPFTLVSNVFQFISGPLKEFKEDLGITDKVTKDRIFLSSKTGKPLTDRAITDIFSKALREIGVSSGSIHGLRRKYANDEIDKEINYRIEKGLDTSVASICAAVSFRLGHASPESLHPYVSARLQRRMKVESPEQKIARLEKELAETRRELAERSPLTPFK